MCIKKNLDRNIATETEDSFNWFHVWWLGVELQCVLLKNDSSHQNSIYQFQMKKFTLSVKHNVAQFATDELRGIDENVGMVSPVL